MRDVCTMLAALGLGSFHVYEEVCVVVLLTIFNHLHLQSNARNLYHHSKPQWSSYTQVFEQEFLAQSAVFFRAEGLRLVAERSASGTQLRLYFIQPNIC